MASNTSTGNDADLSEDLNEDQESDVISLMKAALPEYVVNCFLAAGYDVAEVITSMDIRLVIILVIPLSSLKIMYQKVIPVIRDTQTIQIQQLYII